MISAISTSTSNSTYGVATQVSSSSEKSNIEKQITALQKTITETQSNDKLDDQTKSQQIAVYQAQISQLQAQLSKIETDNTQMSTSGRSKYDTVTISDESRAFGKMPPPLDFENMSDKELTTWLNHMQEKTGSIPVTQDAESVEDLTAEDLQALRETLMEEQTKRMSSLQRGQDPLANAAAQTQILE